MRNFALASVAMMAMLTSSRAEAVTIGLDLGGGVWLVPLTPQFDFHFKVQFALGRDLPAHKIGRLWKFKLSEVDDWVRTQDASVTDDERRSEADK